MGYTAKGAYGLIQGAISNANQYTQQCEYWARLFDGKVSSDVDTVVPSDTFEVSSAVRSVSSGLAFQDVDSLVASVVNPTPGLTLRAKKPALAQSARAQQAVVNTFLTDMNAGKMHRRCAQLAAAFKRGFMQVVWRPGVQRPKFRVIDPRHIMYDLSADTWDDIRWLVNTETMTKGEFDELTKTPKGKGVSAKAKYNKRVATRVSATSVPYHINKTNLGTDEMNERFADAVNLVVIYEFYDFTGKGKVYHFAAGVDEPLFEGDLPFKFMRNPFHMLVFHDALNDTGGISDIDLIGQYQEEIDELFNARLEYVKAGIPIAMFNEGAVENIADVKAQLSRVSGPTDALSIQLAKGVPLRDAIEYTRSPQLSPDFNKTIKDLNELRRETLGLPGYNRGGAAGVDFALELQLADQDRKTRQGWRISAINDLTVWMGQSIIALLAELLPDDTPLWVRAVEDDAPVEVNRQIMGLAEVKGAIGEAPWSIDFTARTQSVFESNPAAQVQQINAAFPILGQLAQMGKVNLDIVAKRYLGALNLMDAFVEAGDRQQQQQAVQGAMGSGGPAEAAGGNPLIAAGSAAAVGPGSAPPLPVGPKSATGEDLG